MVKLLLLVFVVMPSYNAHSHECYVKASYIVNAVWVKEMAIPIAATEVPSLKEVPSRPKDEAMENTLYEPQTPESVGHIDQHDYG